MGLLFPLFRYLYWNEYTAPTPLYPQPPEPTIWRSRLDGTEVEKFMTGNLKNLSGLAIHHKQERCVFYTLGLGGVLESYTLCALFDIHTLVLLPGNLSLGKTRGRLNFAKWFGDNGPGCLWATKMTRFFRGVICEIWPSRRVYKTPLR